MRCRSARALADRLAPLVGSGTGARAALGTEARPAGQMGALESSCEPSAPSRDGTAIRRPRCGLRRGRRRSPPSVRPMRALGIVALLPPRLPLPEESLSPESENQANYIRARSTMNAETKCIADVTLRLEIVPITFRAACAFVAHLHRHNKPPVGHKFSIGLNLGHCLVGVAMAGRPVARSFDDGFTLEVNRTCTDGTPNANSMLYGAVWRCAKAMGYRRAITYTQAAETGASLRAAGWRKVKDLPARASWAQSSVKLRAMRDIIGNGGVDRVLWEITSGVTP